MFELLLQAIYWASYLATYNKISKIKIFKEALKKGWYQQLWERINSLDKLLSFITGVINKGPKNDLISFSSYRVGSLIAQNIAAKLQAKGEAKAAIDVGLNVGATVTVLLGYCYYKNKNKAEIEHLLLDTLGDTFALACSTAGESLLALSLASYKKENPIITTAIQGAAAGILYPVFKKPCSMYY